VKPIITKITAPILALLVLFSTFSFTVEKHFCGDFLVDISYFGNTNGCNDFEVDSCDSKEKVTKKSCCKDEVEEVTGQQDLQTFSKKITLLKKQFLIAFTLSYNNLFIPLKKQIANTKHYSPPNLRINFQVLYEVFII